MRSACALTAGDCWPRESTALPVSRVTERNAKDNDCRNISKSSHSDQRLTSYDAYIAALRRRAYEGRLLKVRVCRAIPAKSASGREQESGKVIGSQAKSRRSLNMRGSTYGSLSASGDFEWTARAGPLYLHAQLALQMRNRASASELDQRLQGQTPASCGSGQMLEYFVQSSRIFAIIFGTPVMAGSPWGPGSYSRDICPLWPARAKSLQTRSISIGL